ncbi:M20 metallopeptidase family protein [Baileyella intestinalis]|uniref:M20 metallopeptidase family protein n=1 Tax=Baileyella intestinalis TaxID=2606709 RepID=UPI003A8630E7
MNIFLKEAQELQPEIIENRRHIHEDPELGFDLPNTRAFVKERLRACGYEPQELGGGIVCTVGKGSPVLLLRADMDALPQTEESGEIFSSKNPGICHSCGHDGHTAMLLAAAKILKKHEDQLDGTVKFMFEAGEEILSGSRRMIAEGVLENPKVNAAMGLHANIGTADPRRSKPGSFSYCAREAAASADEFHIHITGKAAHSSTPDEGISALSIGVNICSQLEQAVSLNVPADQNFVLAIGVIESGTAANVIPGEAIIKGTLRGYSNEYRASLKKRIEEISRNTAEAWGGTATVSYPIGVSPLINDTDMAREMAGYAEDVCNTVTEIPPLPASEDFAELGQFVPVFFGNIGLGSPEEGYEFSQHNPKLRMDERGLYYGTAVFCNCAFNWLKARKK